MKYINEQSYDIGGRSFRYYSGPSTPRFVIHGHPYCNCGGVAISFLNGKWVAVGCLGWDNYPWLCVEGEYCDQPIDALNSFEHKLSYHRCVSGIK